MTYNQIKNEFMTQEVVQALIFLWGVAIGFILGGCVIALIVEIKNEKLNFNVIGVS